MIARVFAVVMLLVVAAGGTAAAQEQPATIVVEGTVLDGTAGGHIGPGLPVFLVSSAGPEYELQAVTDEDGKFRFDSHSLHRPANDSASPSSTREPCMGPSCRSYRA